MHIFLQGLSLFEQEWNSEFGSNKVRKKSAGKDFKIFRGSAKTSVATKKCVNSTKKFVTDKKLRKLAKKVHKWEKNMKKCEERYPNSTNSTGMLPLYHPSQLIISVRISEGFKRQT